MRRFYRDLWKIEYDASFRAWPCPSCESGTLEHKGAKYLVVEETAESKLSRVENEEAWDPTWIEERVAGLLHCTRCDEIVSFTANTKQLELEEYKTGAPIWMSGYLPQFFHPAPPIIELPDDLDDDVRGALQRAFALYWTDPSSSVGCIRTSLELILDHQGISRGRNDKAKGKRFRRSLHERLELFSQRRPELRAHLMAVKWLGNMGTHDAVTHDVALDAFAFVDYVLDELYRERTRRLLQTAKAINRAKGAPKKRAKV